MDAKQAAGIVWGASPAGTTHAPGFEPGTKNFFETVRERRLTEEFPWLDEIIGFREMKEKRVLEVGCGVGYDAYEFCRSGADYTGIDIAPENPIRTKKHLEIYGYYPRVMVGDAENLLFEDGSFDVVYSNGVLHHTPDIERSFRETYRVLKQGGVFWVIVYHKNSIFYWINLFLIRHILLLGFLKRKFKDQLSRVEYTTSGTSPLVNVYNRRGLKKILRNAGFEVETVWVRKLNKDDLPIAKLKKYLWRFIPQKVLDNIGKIFGWYLIVKAKKI